ncbi:MAG: hypothetical protein FJ290_26180, partial [Planctomycetes bacterium]|nr:hypothetical protein [Planctomycetota bacterium]
MKLALLLLAACCLALAAEPIPFELPKDAPPVMKQGRQLGWGLGLETNPLVILKPEPQGSEHARAVGPLAVDAEFKPRSVPDAAAWEKVRAELKKRMAAYFGSLPPRDLPLDPKVEKEEDREDHTLRVVSIAFDKERRGRVGLLAPKGAPKPMPTILLNDRWGGGIDLASKGVYSRAIAAHFVREGLLVAIIEHWDEQFGASSDLCTAGAATHNVMRVVDYLATLGPASGEPRAASREPENGKLEARSSKLAASGRVGYWGHVYGADLIPFIASHEDRLACFVASCTCHSYVRHYDSAF